MTFCFWKKLGCYTSCCQPYFFSSRVFEPPAFRLFLKGLICQTGQLFHYSILGLETDDRAMSLAAVHVLSFCSILELLSVRARVCVCVCLCVSGLWWGVPLAFIVGYLCLLISQSSSLVSLH